MSSAKLLLVVLSAILLSALLHSQVHGQVSLESYIPESIQPNFSCQYPMQCVENPNVNATIDTVGCLKNGICQCFVGYEWNWNNDSSKYYCDEISCDNCTNFNWTCTSGSCVCPKGTTLADDNIRCPPDLPPFGPNDEPPVCGQPSLCGPGAYCYKDNRCHCLLGYNWHRPSETEANCQEIECTTGGNECEVINGICHQSTCICPDHFTNYPGKFINKCHLDLTFDPPCNSTVDCTSGLLAVSGSICNQNKCTCNFGELRLYDVCTKLNCSENVTCPGSSHCDNATHSCVCQDNFRFDPDRMTCVKKPIIIQTTTKPVPECTKNADCKSVMLNGLCDKANGTCVCHSLSHHLSSDRKVCIENVEITSTEKRAASNKVVTIMIIVFVIAIGIPAVVYTCCYLLKHLKHQVDEGKAAAESTNSLKMGSDIKSASYSKKQSKVLGAKVKSQVSKKSAAKALTSKSNVSSRSLKQNSASRPKSKSTSSRLSSALSSKKSSGVVASKTTIKSKISSKSKQGSSISKVSANKEKATNGPSSASKTMPKISFIKNHS